MSASKVRALLDRHGLAAHRDRGQNFLTDPRLAERLVDLAEVSPDEAVIEVGAGLGMLTRALARRSRKVLAVEVDAGLVRALEAEGLPDNVILEHEDAREVDFAARAGELGGKVRLVANLPYSVATPLLRDLLEARASLVGWSVMIQREVARRVFARTGEADYGSLSVLHRLTTRSLGRLDVGPGAFFPAPAVTSTFLALAPLEEAATLDLGPVERVARGAFRYRRKTLQNALSQAGFSGDGVRAALAHCDIDAQLRPEKLDPERWLQLAEALKDGGAWVMSPSAEKNSSA